MVDQHHMDSGEFRGLQSSQVIYDNDCRSDCAVPETPDYPQHDLLVTTNPRKRMALDLDTNTDKISAHVVVTNRSNQTIAFKNQCSIEEGYIVDPDRGILDPGMQVRVQFALDDNFDPLRDVEQEKYIIGVAPYNSSLYPDLDEYFSVAFDSNERLERHIMLPAISEAARKRLVQIAEEQSEQRKKDDDVRRLKRIIYPSLGALFGFVSLYVLFTNFCLPFVEDLQPTKPSMRQLP